MGRASGSGADTRRIMRPTFSWSLVALAALSAFGCAAPRPNVFLIVGDDQGWTDFGFMGHPVVRTPNLDRLASEGACFTSGYVPTSLCRPSLATLLTGLYPHQHRICANDPPEGVERGAMLPFIRHVPTLPRLLGERGYLSLQTGKFWEGSYANAGFTQGMTIDPPGRGRHGDDGLAIGRETLEPIYRFIDACGPRPWFVWYAPMMPHEPHTPPERILRRYAVPDRDVRLARYWAMCEWFDATCGALLDFLDRRGLREGTLVVFVVDNGWIQQTGEARTTRGGFAPKSKLSPYDGGVRTPILLRWPERIRPGRYADPASTVDLAPTILAACGAEPSAEMRGVSLLGAASGRGSLGRAAVFGEIFSHAAADLERPDRGLTHRWVREGEWKLIVPAAPAVAPELYRVAQDPQEEKNVADTEPRRVKHLMDVLDRWWKPADR